MSRPRLALVNASHAAQNTRRNFRRELDADLVEFHVVDEQYPEGFDYDGFVVTGSRSSVYWDEPWYEPTTEWVREAIDRGLPALGICFGHQLLADVLGGTVEDMGEYELGYRTVEQVGADPVFDGVGEEFLVFTTHSDAVTELPPGAELIAENDYGVHGFRKGGVVGVQAHPEYDQRTAEAVTRGKDLPDERIEAVCADITDESYAAACESKQVFENFLQRVRTEAPAAASDD
ncbi:type 1 glutamine amidotransferase [Halorarius halobius]|uniref:type 1 glutamine amidotransferase n=1 Tax=Halorarius halobius TaxID=2962671 RepID=UPI0020CBEC6D|nr:type 1 glutamine amidotransferase [Halorarius halobius]